MRSTPSLMAMRVNHVENFEAPSNLPMFLRSEEHTSELQSRGHLVCRLLLEKKNYTPSGDRLRSLDMGYWLHKDYTVHGYATEAATPLDTCGFRRDMADIITLTTEYIT